MAASKAPRSIADIVAEIRATMAIDKAQGVNRIPVYVLTPKMIEEILNSDDQPDQGNKSRIVRDHAEATGQPVVDAPMSQDDPAANAPADDYEAQLRAEAEAYVQAGLARRDHLNQIKELEDGLEIAGIRVRSARNNAETNPNAIAAGINRSPNMDHAPKGWDKWQLVAQETFAEHADGDFREINYSNAQWLAFCRDVYLHLQADYQELLNTCTCGQDHGSEA